MQQGQAVPAGGACELFETGEDGRIRLLADYCAGWTVQGRERLGARVVHHYWKKKHVFLPWPILLACSFYSPFLFFRFNRTRKVKLTFPVLPDPLACSSY